jgi:hypothetical protein
MNTTATLHPRPARTGLDEHGWLIRAIIATSTLATLACERDSRTPNGYHPPTTCERDANCDAGTPDASTAGFGGAGAAGAGTGGMAGSQAGMGGAGAGGMAGASGAGGAGSGGNTAGTGGGDAGTAGTAPCNGACEGDTPICWRDTCVQCNPDVSEHCAAHPNGPICLEGLCVECTENADCTDPERSRCNPTTNRCTPCTENTHCEGITDGTTPLGVCDDNTCVQCTGRQYEACGIDDQGRQFVCNSLTRTCSNQRENRQGVCATCVSDAACELGMLCVRERHDSQDLDYVCLFRQGAGVGGAPADCTDARPYVGLRMNARSIDDTHADICGLRRTTCKAMHDFGILACEGPASDAACGLVGRSDGLCRQFNTTSYRCTVPCQNSGDCEQGSACNTTTIPRYCDLEPDTCYANTDCPAHAPTCNSDAKRCE